MPKLKSGLGAHQAAVSRRAAEVKRAENKAKMASSTKHSVAEKRALKRQRRERDAQTRALEAKESEAHARAEAARLAAEVGAKPTSAEVEEEEEEEEEEDTMGGGEGEDEEAEGGVVEEQAALAAKALSRATVPIACDDTVLLLGEANFSFARALIEGRGHAGHLVCATAYDSEKDTYDKYPDAAANVEILRAAGARVAFGVDAGALERSHKVVGKGPRWSRVVFNFPHVGKGITDQDRNVRENQVLLLRTLKSVAPLLTVGPSAFPLLVKGKKGKGKGKGPAPKAKRPRSPSFSDDEAANDEEEFGVAGRRTRPVPASFHPPDRQGTLLITLLAQPPYSEWELPKLANRPPPTCPGTREPQPRYRVLRSFDFVPAAWPGYAHRRTIGWREGLSKANNEEIMGRQGRARTWEMAVWDGGRRNA